MKKNSLMKLLFYFIISIISLSATAQEKLDFTLDEAIKYALENNYDYKSSVMDRRITAERVREVVSIGLPQASAHISYNNAFIVPTTIVPGAAFGSPADFIPLQFGIPQKAEIGGDLSQLIFDGRYLIGLKARADLSQMTEHQIKLSEIQVRELITKSYFTALMVSQSKNSLAENKKVLEKLLADTRKVYKEGLIEELDVDRLSLALMNLEKEISKLEYQQELTNSALKFNMGYNLNKPLILKDSLNGFVEAYSKKLPENNFDIKNRIEHKALTLAHKLKGYDVAQQKAGYYPTVVGFVSYGVNAQRKKFEFFNTQTPWYKYGMAGVQMNIPIFDGFARKYKLAQTKIEVEKRKLDVEKFESAALLQVIQAKSGFANALKDYSLQKENLALANKINKKAKIMFKEGLGSSFELASSETEMVKTQLNLTQAAYNLLISKIDFDKATGKLNFENTTK